MYSKAPTAPITGEPKKPPKAPAIELYTSKGRSSLPSLSRISNKASNSSTQKDKWALWSYGSTTPQCDKCLKEDTRDGSGVEAASLGILPLCNS